MQEWLVTQRLPDDGQIVLCFGHHTLCCKEDMEENPDWHKVTFKFSINSYKLKSEIPSDVEDSILEKYKVSEVWQSGPDFEDGFVIGVIKWKELDI